MLSRLKALVRGSSTPSFSSVLFSQFYSKLIFTFIGVINGVCRETTKIGLKERNDLKRAAAGDLCPAGEDIRQIGLFRNEKLVLSNPGNLERFLPHQCGVS